MRPFAKALAACALALGTSNQSFAAANQDPDWPCIQRKIPELSFGQIWTGGDLPSSAKTWSQDKDIAELVKTLAARRLPLNEAQAEIRTYAAKLPAGEAADKLRKLVQGLFEHMNGERSQVIAGIGRYARSQIALAAQLRKEASEVDALRGKPDTDARLIAAHSDRLALQTRIFEERVQSLTFVCEVPTLIEQRLYALAKTVQEVIAARP